MPPLEELLARRPAPPVRIVRPGRNLGFGAGVNRGLAALAGEATPPEWVLVSNPDLLVHAGALAALRDVLESRPSWALVGPRIYTDAGEVYPSVRSFPSFTDAAGHALLALFNPENPFTRRYNPGAPEGDVVTEAGWVSGSCFLARRGALEELGGFDEAYFMYAEDMDLCWRAHDAGWGVGFAGAAAVTHVQGVSTARHPYRMMVAHHRSALRFTLPDDEGLATGRAARWPCSCSECAWPWPPCGWRSAAREGRGRAPALADRRHRGHRGDRAGARGGRRRERPAPRPGAGPRGAGGDLRPAAGLCRVRRGDHAARWGAEGAAHGEHRRRAGRRVRQRLHRRPGSVPLRPRHRGGAVDHRRRLGPAAPPALGRLGNPLRAVWAAPGTPSPWRSAPGRSTVSASRRSS